MTAFDVFLYAIAAVLGVMVAPFAITAAFVLIAGVFCVIGFVCIWCYEENNGEATMIDHHDQTRWASLIPNEHWTRARRWCHNHGSEALWLALLVGIVAVCGVVIGVTVGRLG